MRKILIVREAGQDASSGTDPSISKSQHAIEVTQDWGYTCHGVSVFSLRCENISPFAIMPKMADNRTHLVLENYIGGKFVPCSRHIDSYDPSTGEVYCKVPDSDKEEVEAAVKAAQEAFPEWSSRSPAERAKVLHKLADLIDAHLEEFAQAESKDQGKTITFARDRGHSQIGLQLPLLRLVHPAPHHRLQPDGPHGLRQLHRPQPCGSGWIDQPLEPPPLPPDLEDRSRHRRGQHGGGQAQRDDVSHGLDAVQTAGGGRCAPWGGEHRVWDGPAGGGRPWCHTPSAPYCKKLSLELGGKNPAIIFQDADLDECIPTTIRSSFSNQGEICLCTSRIFVERSIYPEFLQRFVEAARKLKTGVPTDTRSNNGALISQEHLEKVRGYVKLAQAEGGKVHCGEGVDTLDLPERYRDGYFMPPTVISDVTDGSRCMQEEIFGPVACVLPFDGEEEAVRRANGVKYGLSATVWSRDVGRVHRVARGLQTGLVWTNCWLIRDLNLPLWGDEEFGDRSGRAGETPTTSSPRFNAPQ
ncbi:hypothetical protein SKAU_G00185540 [Synaphobranchus kaupii]|uniref:Aldehyde dehydrogenase domain-containing protein n=1 Tax=Synaphobranchus kaupii TaxID=118154 RepID=A0A9Q1FCX5_SYNKA|nr:hypothetical protein SKAU_G00185540 [Synaphobranchus kaupii]